MYGRGSGGQDMRNCTYCRHPESEHSDTKCVVSGCDCESYEDKEPLSDADVGLEENHSINKGRGVMNE